MAPPDFNLLATLDVLLTEGSVAGAARRLRLSPSAMSRTLARLRRATGDPLLVRAGRGLVPTPRALELRERVSQLVPEVEAVLRPATTLHLADLERTFTLRTSDGFTENFGGALMARVRADAPRVRLRFIHKVTKESPGLRDGSVDLEVGVVGRAIGPEVRAQSLFRDRLVGVVHAGHALSRQRVTPARFAAGQHVLVSRRGQDHGPIEEELARHGLTRDISAIVSGFAAALSLARTTDLVAVVPERHTGTLREGMFSFALPLDLPDFAVSLLWHPRMDADPAHRWLRNCVRDVCAVRPTTRR